MIISIANQKGGVAKTTTAINLCAALGERGYKVLLTDFDPQGNATSGCGVSKRELSKTSYTVVMGECRPADAVVATGFDNFYIIPATQELAEADTRLMKFENKTLQLRKALLQLESEYDIVIIDSLPSLGILALNALAASDGVVIPMQCEPYSLEGLSELMANIKRVKNVNKSLSIMGIVFTMTDKRLNINREVMKKIREHFPKDLIFATEIPRNVKVAEAPSHGKPVIYYDKGGAGASAYERLADEVAGRLGKPRVGAGVSGGASVSGGAGVSDGGHSEPAKREITEAGVSERE